VLENTISSLSSIGFFSPEEVIVQDVRFDKYSNVIFDHGIYDNRAIVLEYLEASGISSIGRFGKWDYLWTHQAYSDGQKEAERIVEMIT
jgi:protoporphyrinogen oxidase